MNKEQVKAGLKRLKQLEHALYSQIAEIEQHLESGSEIVLISVKPVETQKEEMVSVKVTGITHKNKIPAIKVVRKHTPADLQEAKLAIEACMFETSDFAMKFSHFMIPASRAEEFAREIREIGGFAVIAQPIDPHA